MIKAFARERFKKQDEQKALEAEQKALEAEKQASEAKKKALEIQEKNKKYSEKIKEEEDKEIAEYKAKEREILNKLWQLQNPKPKIENIIKDKEKIWSETFDAFHQLLSRNHYEKRLLEEELKEQTTREMQEKINKELKENEEKAIELNKSINENLNEVQKQVEDIKMQSETDIDLDNTDFCINKQLIVELLNAIYGNVNVTKKQWEEYAKNVEYTPFTKEEKEIKGLKKGIINILSDCKNIYKNLDANFFLKTFLKEPSDKASECDKRNISVLRRFFNNSYNDLQEIANKINTEEIKNGINETNEILQNPIKSISSNALQELIKNTPCYQSILNNASIRINFDENCELKRPYLCFTLLLFYIAAIKDINVKISNNTDTGSEDLSIMNETFNKTPITLDARQFITVNRFTKFRNQKDKVCFLFHGVGTGKTITSTTIALSHLNENNIFNTNDIGNEGKKPLEILVMCPQGLFFSAFAGDSEKLGIYVYNKTIKEVTRVEINYTFEFFDASIKIDENRIYKLKFTGFDYINLFKQHGIYQIINKYDVLICDEAHKIITDKLKPFGKKTYRTDYGGKNIDGTPNPDGKTVFPETKEDDPFVVAIRDIRFYKFITEKIEKQAILLSGTPIQKSMEDLVSITKFLNLKEINESNNKKFCEDVIKEANVNNEGYFNNLYSTDSLIRNDAYKGFLAKAFTFCQNQSESEIQQFAQEVGFPLEYIGIKSKGYDATKEIYNPNALGPIALAKKRKEAEEEHNKRMKLVEEEKRDRQILAKIQNTKSEAAKDTVDLLDNLGFTRGGSNSLQ